jgi:hypothetical protein
MIDVLSYLIAYTEHYVAFVLHNILYSFLCRLQSLETFLKLGVYCGESIFI